MRRTDSPNAHRLLNALGQQLDELAVTVAAADRLVADVIDWMS